jgi:predicted nucleic acid-binding protein
MRKFVVKFLALQNSIYHAQSLTSGIYQHAKICCTLDEAWDILWNSFKDDDDPQHWDFEEAQRFSAHNVTSSVVEKDADNLLETLKGKSSREVNDCICLLMMNKYEEIVLGIDKTVDDIKFKENFDWSQVIRKIITLDENLLKELNSMNSRLLLFYLLRVHELASSINEQIVVEFHQFLEKLDISFEYNQLFLPSISLKRVETMTNMPRDLVKIIFNYLNLAFCEDDDDNVIDFLPVDLVKIIRNYSNPSIYNVDDVALIFNKMRGC